MATTVLKDKIPPSNAEAEVATLGALLLDPEALSTVIRYLRPEDFYKTSHQRVYEGILNLFERSEAIDLITLTGELKNSGLLEACGGAAYISRLTSAVPTPNQTSWLRFRFTLELNLSISIWPSATSSCRSPTSAS